jgi:dUTP pyrophosphatase
LIATDLQIKLPEGCNGRIATRTDLAMYHIVVGAGVNDRDFRGNLSVLLYNHSEIPYHISRGDKIAKSVKKLYYPELDLVEKLDDTWRGARFGSTGQN